MEKIKIAVKTEDMVVRVPGTYEKLTTQGKIVEKTPYWMRRLNSGDVIELPIGD
jgi:hypothetical protein